MDVTLARFREDPEGDGRFAPDDESYRSMMAQLGFAIAPTLISGARTTGVRHFYLGVETSIAQIDDGARYWQIGTEGDSMSVGENRFVKNVLTMTRLHLRKGLPYGLELGLNAGRIFNTSYWVWGGSVKIALFEGFRSGLAGWLPDVAVRGSVTTLTGDDEFSLTVPSVDVVISKPLVIAQTVVLTPIVGVQFIWVAADAESIDVTPDIDQWDDCAANPVSGTAMGTDYAVPRPTCTGPTRDFVNELEYSRLRAFRARMVLGFNLRYQAMHLGASIHWDLRAPSNIDSDVPENTANQFTVTVAAGIRY